MHCLNSLKSQELCCFILECRSTTVWCKLSSIMNYIIVGAIQDKFWRLRPHTMTYCSFGSFSPSVVCNYFQNVALSFNRPSTSHLYSTNVSFKTMWCQNFIIACLYVLFNLLTKIFIHICVFLSIIYIFYYITISYISPIMQIINWISVIFLFLFNVSFIFLFPKNE